MLSRVVTIVLLGCAAVASAQDGRSKSFGGERSRTSSQSSGRDARDSAGSGGERSDADGARFLLEKYDDNKNRVLEESEWRKIASGTPEKADYNRDKRITFDELVKRLAQKRRAKEAMERLDRAKAAKDDGPRSLRLTTALDRLPDELPSWFTQKDRNRDGQVAMHEYERRWNDSTVRRFAKYDQNDDGFITPGEALSGR